MADSVPHARLPHDDAHSSASDEDGKPVEVLFDPTSPYRRKSSISEPRRQRLPPHTGCLVHQFFEGLRRSRNYSAGDGHQDNDTDDEFDNDSDNDNHHEPNDHHSPGKPLGILPPPHTAAHPHSRPELDRMVEPKGSRVEPRAGTSSDDEGLDSTFSVEPTAAATATAGEGAVVDNGVRNVDEQEWQAAITKTESELDMLYHQVAGRDRDREHQKANSRLLTKKQLGEMAWGVRELSRRLGSIRLKISVRTIFLLTKIWDPELIGKTRELTRWLLDRRRDVPYIVYVDRNLRDNIMFDAPGLLDDVRRDYQTASTSEPERRGASGAQEQHLSKRLRYWDDQVCMARPHTFDFVITLGGDGTVLYASWLFQRIVPPVLSFALGSLGFLTKFDFHDFPQTLETAFQDGVTVSLRLRFEATVMRSQPRRKMASAKAKGRDQPQGNGTAAEQAPVDDETWPMRDLIEELIGEEKDDEHTHRPDGTYEVLNEIVLDRGPNATMSSIEVFGDDEYFTSIQADGVCVSTPTGSTAYNLAAGGSLCHPENPVMLVTSICAHTLSFRPIILPDTIVLRVGVPYDARTTSWASFDGRARIELHPGDYVTISASRYPFASVQAQGRRSESWIKSISGKLGWNTRQRPKSYQGWSP